MSDQGMSIGEVSQKTGLSERQIRYYEKQGLVSPRRTQGRQRIYGTFEVERLLEVRRLLDAGQTLAVARRVITSARGAPESDVRSRLLAGQALRSLYPVSNRAELERVLQERAILAEEDEVD